MFYYSDFDLCQIDKNYRTKVYATYLGGCTAFAVHAEKFLFNGQYDDDLTTGYLGAISDAGVCDVSKVAFELPDSRAMEKPVFVGRGPTLEIFDRGKWFRYDLSAGGP